MHNTDIITIVDTPAFLGFTSFGGCFDAACSFKLLVLNRIYDLGRYCAAVWQSLLIISFIEPLMLVLYD